jgi:hypothetical protein
MDQKHGESEQAAHKATENPRDKSVSRTKGIKWTWEYWSERPESILLLFASGIFVPLLGDFMSKQTKVWAIGFSAWMLCAAIIIFVCKSVISTINREQQPSPATQPAKISEELKNTFAQLRDNFQTLAMQSKGLYHVFTEEKDRKQARLTNLPPGFVEDGPIGDPRKIIGFATLPSDYPIPRKLSDAEISSIPNSIEQDEYIRDRQGRALAVWQPLVTRFGLLRGDGSVCQQFDTLAEAAGTALLGIPNDVVKRLPENISSLCRLQRGGTRRYIFGDGNNGVLLDVPMPGDSDFDSRMPRWLLCIHRLGWDSPAGSPLRASRWYWDGSVSVAFHPGHPMPQNPFLPSDKVPTNRFCSVLGNSLSSPMDICYASAWALDRLMNMII